MSSSSDDEHDQFCDYVDQCTRDVISDQPYWAMSADQRAEWVRYARQKKARERLYLQQSSDIPEEAPSESDDGEDEVEPEQNEAGPVDTTQHEPEEEEPKKRDKRQLWRDYQTIARHMLKEEGTLKPSLSLVNARARDMYRSDGHMAHSEPSA